MSTYFKLGSLIEGIAVVPTAGGTTTLIASSKTIQVFTGTSTQTVVLPDATSLSMARRFDINNRSTEIVAVQASGGGALATVPAGSQLYFILTDKSTAAGQWVVGGIQSDSGSGVDVSDDDTKGILSGLAGTYLDSETIVSREIKYNPEEIGGNYWKSLTVLPLGKGMFSVFSVNGNYHSVGGYTGSIVDNHVRYNRDVNNWLGRMTRTATRLGAGFSDSNFGYDAGGDTGSITNATFKYNPIADSWSGAANLIAARNLHAATYSGSHGYVFGGVSSTEQYNPISNIWATRLTAYPDSIIYSLTSSHFEGASYIAGGDAGSNTGSNSVKRYDDALNTITSIPNLSTGRRYAASFVTSGKLYISGGYTGAGYSGIDTTEIYDSNTRTWLAGGKLATGRGEVSGGQCDLEGFGLVAGGYLSGYITNVEEFNAFSYVNLGVLKRTTANLTSLILAVKAKNLTSEVPVQIRTDGDNWKNIFTGSSVLKEGESLPVKFQAYAKPYIFGGAPPSLPNTTGIYNYVNESNIWNTKGNLPEARGSTAVFSVNRKTYIAGGSNNSGLVNTNIQYDEFLNSSVYKATISSARNAMPAFMLNGFGYTVAGNDGSAVQVVQSYSADVDSWATKQNYPVAVHSGAASSINGYGFGFGGNISGASGTSYRYSDVDNTWTAITSMSQASVSHCGSAVSGKAYTYSYYAGGSPVFSTAHSYNSLTNTWSAISSMPGTLLSSSAMAADSYCYAVNTDPFNGSVNPSNYRYGTDANTWVSRQTAPTNAYGGHATPTYTGSFYNLEVKVGVPASYLGAGGGVWVSRSNLITANSQKDRFSIGKDIYSNDTSSFQKYDTVADATINYPAPADTIRATHCAEAVNGRGYVASGFNGSFVKTVEQYNPEITSWATKASTANDHYSGSGMVLNGLLYVVSSYNNSSTERYNEVTNTWSTLANVASIVGQNVCLAAEGHGYSVSGSTGGPSTTNVYTYNDAANTWSVAPSVSQSRDYSGLANVVGGMISYGSSSVMTATAERLVTGLKVWVAAPSMIVSSQGTNHAQVSDNAYRVGGYNGSNLTSIESYRNPVKDAIVGIALEVK